MNDEKHFKLFFICPHCGRPKVSVDKLEEYINEDAVYCTHCGKNIANALAEALTELKMNIL